MKSTLKLTNAFIITLLSVILFSTSNGFAQTKGMIYKPAISAGKKVLDPNLDGFVSVARNPAGFIGTNDEGAAYSEIPYRPFPAMINEPMNDLVTGSNGGHTDLAPSQSLGATGSPISAYFDGTNLLFRVRLGGQSTASKGYSVMIDSDGQYGNLVSGKTPSKTPNPGFEFEVILASNFDVSIYDHRNNPEGGSKIWTGSVDQYFQKAVAASKASGDDDYFYDFYVPLSGFAGGIDVNTQLRMSGITITSAQTGISGTVSDIGGVNFSGTYAGDARRAWMDIINSFPGVSLNQLRNGGFPSIGILPKPPVVSDPVKSTDTSIKGTSSQPAGSTITVFRNGISICGGNGQPVCTTVSSTGTWVLTGIPIGTLYRGDQITATVTASGKTSVHSVAVTVVAPANTCTTTIAPTTIGTNNGNLKSLQGTSVYSGVQRINLYKINGTTGQATFHSFYNIPSTYIKGETWDMGVELADGMWAVTTTPKGMCESPRSNEVCYNGQGNSAFNNAPDITLTRVTYSDGRPGSTSDEVAKNIQTLYGKFTSTPKSTTAIYLYVNGVKQPEFSISVATTNEWAMNVSSYVFKEGDFLNVRAVDLNSKNGSYTCGDLASKASNFKSVYNLSIAPIINTSQNCGNTTSVTGTSVEPTGTIINLYNSTTSATSLGSTTVGSNGIWTITNLNLVPGSTYYAKATSSPRVESIASNPLTINVAYPGSLPAITSNTVEGKTSVSGSGANGHVITLYISGSPYATTAIVAGGLWTITGIPTLELYAGVELYVTAKTSTSCESAASAIRTVTCLQPQSSFTVKGPTEKVCHNSPATITLMGSQLNVIYTLHIGGVRTGTSVMGTGGSISLQTDNLTTDPTVIQVKASKIGSKDCETNVGSAQSIAVYPIIPNAYTITATNMVACPNSQSVFTVENALGGHKYQLYNVSKNQLVGEVITRTSNGTFSFTGLRIDASATYSVLITNTASGCQVQNTKTVSITRNGPNVTMTAWADKSQVCEGTGTAIFFGTESGYNYKLINKQTGTQHPGTSTITGTGNTMSINTGNLASGTHTFQVQVTGASCVSLYTLEATVLSSKLIENVNAGQDVIVCESSYTLDATNPNSSTGVWSVKTKPNGAPNPSFSPNTGTFNATVAGLVSGTYELTWTVINTCSGSPTTTSKTVKITRNCPAEFSVKTTKYIEDYKNNEELVTMSDVDGDINHAMIISGIIPPGTSLNTSTGKLSVMDRRELRPGSYNYSVRTTDARGIPTDNQINVRMLDATDSYSSMQTLSVDFASFTANYTNNKVVLQWATASEEDNDYFEIEKSINGIDFKKTGIVKGNGNTTQTVQYTFTDANILSGTSYYRLKQVDFNGTYTYSKVVAVTVKHTTQQATQAYPNPFTKELFVNIASEISGEITMQLLSTDGIIVYSNSAMLEKGFQEISLPLHNLNQGMYLLRVTGNGINQTHKVMKTH